MTFLLGLLLLSTGPAAGDSLLTLDATIPLAHVNGRIDHMAFDPKRQRIYVAALGNNSIEIVDLKNRKYIDHIKDLNEPQGVAYVPYSDYIVVTNGGDGYVDFYDAGSLKYLANVRVGGDADNIRWDPKLNRLVVGFGEGGLAILDVREMRKLSRVPLPSHPESFQIDPSGHVAFVNVPQNNEVLKVDLESGEILQHWPTSPSGNNYPMAYDAAHGCVYVGCRTRTSLLALNTESGKLQTRTTLSEDVDDIWYDASASRLYASCGSGVLEVFHIDAGAGFEPLLSIKTSKGARTSLYVPERGEIIVAAPATATTPAALLIYRIHR
jgi:DNA-binding beta-propeller fold protein YncE